MAVFPRPKLPDRLRNSHSTEYGESNKTLSYRTGWNDNYRVRSTIIQIQPTLLIVAQVWLCLVVPSAVRPVRPRSRLDLKYLRLCAPILIAFSSSH